MDERFRILMPHSPVRFGSKRSAPALLCDHHVASTKRDFRTAFRKDEGNLGLPRLVERLLVVSPPRTGDLTECAYRSTP